LTPVPSSLIVILGLPRAPPGEGLARLPRKAGVAVLVLVVAHVGVLLIDDSARLALFDLRTAPPRARPACSRCSAVAVVAGYAVAKRPIVRSGRTPGRYSAKMRW
jgi:hypothetical protein